MQLLHFNILKNNIKKSFHYKRMFITEASFQINSVVLGLKSVYLVVFIHKYMKVFIADNIVYIYVFIKSLQMR